MDSADSGIAAARQGTDKEVQNAGKNIRLHSAIEAKKG